MGALLSTAEHMRGENHEACTLNSFSRNVEVKESSIRDESWSIRVEKWENTEGEENFF